MADARARLPPASGRAGERVTVEERDEQRRDALVPLDVLEARFGISRRTLFYWLKADSITTHGNGTKERAVRWGDVEDASMRSTRWPEATGLHSKL
ncbi:hypothetical protein QE418_003408 [Microbacterium testaceum]|uniref:hypothetical protein n=1 Tax=Microbacterium TaxID=33882 RepID=UPI0027878AA9|nr:MULTISPECIES: hypothetical protein [Microbacterium]MDQ1113960.1 hypothetical protein [Microbacterium testaceum]